MDTGISSFISENWTHLSVAIFVFLTGTLYTSYNGWKSSVIEGGKLEDIHSDIRATRKDFSDFFSNKPSPSAGEPEKTKVFEDLIRTTINLNKKNAATKKAKKFHDSLMVFFNSTWRDLSALKHHDLERYDNVKKDILILFLSLLSLDINDINYIKINNVLFIDLDDGNYQILSAVVKRSAPKVTIIWKNPQLNINHKIIPNVFGFKLKLENKDDINQVMGFEADAEL